MAPLVLRLTLRTRLTLVFLAMASVLMACAIGVFYAEAHNVLREEFRNRLIAISAAAASVVDGDDHPRIKAEGDAPYARIRATLVQVKNATDVRSIYTMYKGPQGTWRYAVDSAPPGDEDHAAFAEKFVGTGLDTMEAGLATPSADHVFTHEPYGTWLSGFAPIRDHLGKTVATLGVDLSADFVINEENRLFGIALSIFLGGCLFAIAISVWLARVLTRPVSELVEGTRKVAEGDLDSRVPQARRDELGDLARSFNSMVGAILNQREELKESERMSQELATARRIQQAMLPASAPLSASLNIDFYLETSTEVGGDYFDFLPVDEHKLAIVIGDVTGHGVPAALLMAVVKSCLHTQVLSDYRVAEVLNIANRILNQSRFDRRFMTFFYALLDTDTGELTYGNAGHLYPYLYRAATREVQVLEMASYPLGVRPDLVVREQHLKLEPGDLMLFYSDGIIEAQNQAGEEFGFERLEKFVQDHGHLKAELLKEKLLIAWKRFVFGETVPLDDPRVRAEDDVTVVVVRYTPARVATAPFV